MDPAAGQSAVKSTAVYRKGAAGHLNVTFLETGGKMRGFAIAARNFHLAAVFGVV